MFSANETDRWHVRIFPVLPCGGYIVQEWSGGEISEIYCFSGDNRVENFCEVVDFLYSSIGGDEGDWSEKRVYPIILPGDEREDFAREFEKMCAGFGFRVVREETENES